MWVAVLTGMGSLGAGLGYAAGRDPVGFLVVPAGIVFVGAAPGIRVGLAIGLAEGLRLQEVMCFTQGGCQCRG